MKNFIKKNNNKFSKWFRKFLKKIETTKEIKMKVLRRLIYWEERNIVDMGDIQNIVDSWLIWNKVVTSTHSTMATLTYVIINWNKDNKHNINNLKTLTDFHWFITKFQEGEKLDFYVKPFHETKDYYLGGWFWIDSEDDRTNEIYSIVEDYIFPINNWEDFYKVIKKLWKI